MDSGDDSRKARRLATHGHFHMIGPSVVLLVNDFKKVPPLYGQPVKTVNESEIIVNSEDPQP